MVFRLTLSSVDDDEEVTEYETLDAAIGAAAEWFRSGYEDNPTIVEIPKELEADVATLRADLASGREYHCGRFHEHVRIDAALNPA
jgi:hypothetical protein